MGIISRLMTAVTLGLVVAAAGNGAPLPGAGGEPGDGGWTLELANDGLGFVSGDQNFSAGLAVTLHGTRARDTWISLDPVLGWINAGLPLPRSGLRRHALEFGLAMFTPGALGESEPIRDDHPYACLPFLANTRRDVEAGAALAYQSTLLLGVLGTDLCEHLQREAHELINDTLPRGWDNQISEGGEPTARYSLARRSLLYLGTADAGRGELVWNLEGAAGFTTHLGLGLDWRWGQFASAWWSRAPSQNEYLGLGAGVVTGRERYLFGGFSLRARAYNALLQGQFRDSRVTFDRDQLRVVVAEGWLGATTSLGRHRQLSFVFRVRSPELRPAKQNIPVSGSLIFSFAP